MRGTALTGIDKSFFHIESPQHLMTVASLSIFHDPIGMEEITEVLQEMVDRFSRFRQRVTKPRKLTKERYWEEYDFDISRHVTEIILPDNEESTAEDPPEFRACISELMSTPLDETVALWHCNIIRYQNNRTAMFFRVHHCITDGQGAVRCLLSITTTETPDSMNSLQYGQQKAEKTPPTKPKANLLTQTIQTVTFLPKLFLMLFLFFFQFTWGMILSTYHFIHICFIYQRNHFKGELTREKTVSFISDVNLNDVKDIKNHFGVTVNDVLVSSLAGSFREYLLARDGKIKDDDLLCYIPISMRSPNDWELGNKVSIVYAHLPLNIGDPVKRLNTVHKRMDQIKKSKEPLAAYYFTQILGNSPLADLAISKYLIQRVVSKPHSVFTNVPGPRVPLYFCGKKIQRFIPFIPQPGQGGLGVALLSYADIVSCSILGDKEMLPDNGSSITSGLNQNLQQLKQIMNTK